MDFGLSLTWKIQPECFMTQNNLLLFQLLQWNEKTDSVQGSQKLEIGLNWEKKVCDKFNVKDWATAI